MISSSGPPEVRNDFADIKTCGEIFQPTCYLAKCLQHENHIVPRGGVLCQYNCALLGYFSTSSPSNSLRLSDTGLGSKVRHSPGRPSSLKASEGLVLACILSSSTGPNIVPLLAEVELLTAAILHLNSAGDGQEWLLLRT